MKRSQKLIDHGLLVVALFLVMAILALGAWLLVFAGDEKKQIEMFFSDVLSRELAAELPTTGTKDWYGVYFAESTETVAHVDELLGAQADIMAVFESWSEEGLATQEKISEVCRSGRLPLISWQSWGGKDSGISYDLADIATGTYDAYIDAFAKDVVAACGDRPVLVRFDHEMEMRPSYGYPWTPWQGRPDEYVAAWRHVVERVRSQQGGEHLYWLWSPNRADEYILPYYPGNDVVDYVGVTLNHPTVTGTVYESFQAFYEPNKLALEQFNKPIIIGEAAYNFQSMSTYEPWVRGAFAYVAQDPRLVAVVWFNQELGHVNYGITTHPDRAQLFQELLTTY